MQSEKCTAPAAVNSSCVVTLESIEAFIQHEQSQGVSANTLRRCRCFTFSLYEWLPTDKSITRDLLIDWRQNLKARGYSPATELNYVKGINSYLDYIGRSDLRFNRGRTKNIAGRQFGYLTAIEQTGEKDRRDYIWRCRCRCGREVKLTATRLLVGNTMSCGCLRRENLNAVNKYCDGTSIRQSLEERVYSFRARSGYTGVTRKRDKWKAYINYKGRRYSLGTYDRLEEAVKARAEGKELVRINATELLNDYEEKHKTDPERPSRSVPGKSLE